VEQDKIVSYVLDSFAVISYLQDEPDSEKIEKILEKAKSGKVKVYMHKINLGEIFYITCREEGEAIADSVYAMVKEYPVEFVDDLSEDFLLSAGRLKATYPISYADAFAAGLTIQKEGILITGDPDFKKLETENKIKVFWVGGSRLD